MLFLRQGEPHYESVPRTNQLTDCMQVTGDLWEKFVKIVEEESLTEGYGSQPRALSIPQALTPRDLETRWTSLAASGIAAAA